MILGDLFVNLNFDNDKIYLFEWINFKFRILPYVRILLNYAN